ncbi:MAG: hypothetical protein D6759_10425 [Chloroflexi bacterium]|nr:MAG: hypothetical protein D6759_10425 [Chloroflexota bacterium]
MGSEGFLGLTLDELILIVKIVVGLVVALFVLQLLLKLGKALLQLGCLLILVAIFVLLFLQMTN